MGVGGIPCCLTPEAFDAGIFVRFDLLVLFALDDLRHRCGSIGLVF